MAVVGGLAVGRNRTRLPVSVVGNTPDADAMALIARMTVQPDDARKALINKTVVDLKNFGLWSRMTALWFPAAHDAQAAQLNWIADQYNLTPMNSPAFTADRGYMGDGTSSYLDTGLALNVGATTATSSTAIGAYVNGGADGVNTGVVIGGGNNNDAAFVRPWSTAGGINGRVNSNSSTTTDFGTLTTRYGLSVLSRTGSAAISAYRNGSPIAAATPASSARAAQTLKLLAYLQTSTVSLFLANQVAMAFASSGLSDLGAANLYTITQNYLSNIGASV